MAGLITAKDHAKREGHPSVKRRIQRMSQRLHERGLLSTPFRDVAPVEPAVIARVDFGQWLADCECGGAEAVDPDEPIFFCFSCGNRASGGVPRKVKFPTPKQREQIEAILLERPVDDSRGLDEVDRAFKARPLVVVNDEGRNLVFSRSWSPDEKISDLKGQNAIMKALKEAK